MRALAASHVFDGDVVHRDAAVVIDGTDIAQVVPRADLPSGIAWDSLPDGAWLAPGFIDLQVNGGGDVLFNDQPTPEGIRTIAAAQCLLELGTDVTADVLPFVGHEVPDEMADLVLERLRGYLPQRRWREAMQAHEAVNPQGRRP